MVNDDKLYRLVQIDPSGAKTHVSQWNESKDAIKLLAIRAISALASQWCIDRTNARGGILSESDLLMIWSFYQQMQRRIDAVTADDNYISFAGWVLIIEIDSIDGAYQQHLQEKGYDL